MPELSTYVNSLASATLVGSDVLYLADDEKTTAQAIANLNGAFATKVVSIGNWNMDTNVSLSVAHGLTFTNIRDVSVLIINDASDTFVHLNSCDAIGVGNGIVSFNNTNIDMSRVAGGRFDNIDYDASPFNRGYITITYAL